MTVRQLTGVCMHVCEHLVRVHICVVCDSVCTVWCVSVRVSVHVWVNVRECVQQAGAGWAPALVGNFPPEAQTPLRLQSPKRKRCHQRMEAFFYHFLNPCHVVKKCWAWIFQVRSSLGGRAGWSRPSCVKEGRGHGSPQPNWHSPLRHLLDDCPGRAVLKLLGHGRVVLWPDSHL